MKIARLKGWRGEIWTGRLHRELATGVEVGVAERDWERFEYRDE
jgi:hypothetical protein